MPNPLNLCALCREDFASLRLFDQHIVGKPADRRRGCLTPEQMEERGWQKDARGRWSDPKAVAEVGNRLRGTAGSL